MIPLFCDLKKLLNRLVFLISLHNVLLFLLTLKQKMNLLTAWLRRFRYERVFIMHLHYQTLANSVSFPQSQDQPGW